MKAITTRTANLPAMVLAFMMPAFAAKVNSAFPSSSSDKAEKTLPVSPLSITSSDGKVHGFKVEVATQAADQEKGLMYRRTLGADGGMLFVWPMPREAVMWMRNTFVPLDIVFIDEKHQVAAISENAVPLSEAHIFGHGLTEAVLELPAGTTARFDIRVGDRISSNALSEGRK